MKILYHFRTRGTGAEAVHVAGISSALEALGHTVVFSSPLNVDPRRTAGSSPFGKQTALPLPAFAFELLELGYNLVAFVRNAIVIARERPDFVYERHAFYLCSSAVLCRLVRLPLVVEVNELVGNPRVRHQPLLAPLARGADRITFGLARLVIVVSPDLRRRVMALGIAGEKVLVLPNAVRRKEVESPADGRAVRESLGCRPDTVLVGFVGWFVEWHRLDLFVDVFAELARADDALRLVLVGEGPLESRLRRQVDGLGLGDRVVFGGPVPRDEIPSHVAAMDVAVVPHSNEYRSPIKLFEYMSQGRAVVAPATEPIATVVRSGEHALLFEPGSREGLATALRDLASDRERRSRLGRAARALVLERHTWERNAEAFLAAASLGPS